MSERPTTRSQAKAGPEAGPRDSALVPEGAGVRAAGGLYVGVRVCEACGFVCGVGQLLGRYGAEGSGAARGL